jgi:hypothetical protein
VGSAATFVYGVGVKEMVVVGDIPGDDHVYVTRRVWDLEFRSLASIVQTSMSCLSGPNCAVFVYLFGEYHCLHVGQKNIHC